MLRMPSRYLEELMEEFKILFEVTHREIGVKYAAEEAIYEVLRRHQLDDDNTYARNFRRNVIEYISKFGIESA